MNDARSPVEALPLLTADVPGIGGRIKRYDEDFLVEEIPLYEPGGEGTHVYFTIEKRGLTTLAAVRILALALGRKPQEIGYAGMKDAHGVTRQRLSLEHIDPRRVESLDLPRIRVLSISRHTNKLKLGHLAGNRFDIKIRETAPNGECSARRVMEVLARRGAPNYFGPQRFGARGDNALVGRAVLLGRYDEAFSIMLGRPRPEEQPDVRRARSLFDEGNLAEAARAWPKGFGESARLCRALLRCDGDARRAWRSVHHTLRKLYVSALQSDLFNRVLARRIGELDRLCDGDVAWIHRNGSCFRVERAAVEQPRCDRFEISPSGPLFGKNMLEPDGQPADIERAVLAESGLTADVFARADGGRLCGARRPLRVPVTDAGVESGTDERGPYVRLTFRLPPGAYATSVVREVCRPVSP